MSVFISYRRDDTAHVAGRLYDRLVDRFGAAAVFKDVDSIPAGSDFREVLHSAVKKASVVVVLIGHRFEGDASDGPSRLAEPSDFVRIELEAALAQGIPVIPVLVDGGRMPAASRLPESLSNLIYRQAVTLRPDPDFQADAQRICRSVGELISGSEPTSASTTATKAATPSSKRSAVTTATSRSRSIGRWRLKTISVRILAFVAALVPIIVFVSIGGLQWFRPEEVTERPSAPPEMEGEAASPDSAAFLSGSPAPTGTRFEVQLNAVRFVQETRVRTEDVRQGDAVVSVEKEYVVERPVTETRQYEVVRYPVVENFLKDGTDYYRITLVLSENETLTVVATAPPQSVRVISAASPAAPAPQMEEPSVSPPAPPPN